MALGESLEKYTFTYLLGRSLERVPDTVDKREGSIIYDALAPACYELADYYMQLRQNYLDTFVLTAKGNYLDSRIAERGLSRYQATNAVRRGDFATASGAAMEIPIGSRFSTIAETETVNYRVIAAYANLNGNAIAGAYQLECEETGTVGNAYTGDLLPIDYIYGLSKAKLSTIIQPARDIETDDEVLARYLDAVNSIPFGGNIAQYDEQVRNIDGVGEVQVYPVWHGGGTVKLSVIDAEYNPITADFASLLQNKIDPENAQGKRGTGLGLAPIGHIVTVVSPDIFTINIETSIKLMAGCVLSQVEDSIIKAIAAYLLILRQVWGVPDTYNNYSSSVYKAQINAAILSINGVANVTGTLLNGLGDDINLQQNGTKQELPVLGMVKINAN